MGKDKFFETGKPAHDLYGRFTTQRDGRFMVVINEASGSDNFTADDTIKDMITSSSYSSEGKGTNAFTLRCFARFVFTTNNDNCLKIKSDSRRYVVFEVSMARKGDDDYFDRLSAHMGDEHTQHEFYKFLMGRDISKRRWIRDRPITQGYTQMVEANMPYEHAFLKEKVENLRAAKQTEHTRGAEEMASEFQKWLLDNGPGPNGRPYDTNAKKFGGKLSKLTADNVSTGGFKGLVKRRCMHG